MVLNAAARLIVRKQKFDSISSRYVTSCIDCRSNSVSMYKLCTLVSNCLHDVAPVYLSTMCQPVSENIGQRSLRSATRGDLAVLITWTAHCGLRSFAVVGLSIHVYGTLCRRRCATSPTSLYCQLKTFLFVRAYASSSRS